MLANRDRQLQLWFRRCALTFVIGLFALVVPDLLPTSAFLEGPIGDAYVSLLLPLTLAAYMLAFGLRLRQFGLTRRRAIQVTVVLGWVSYCIFVGGITLLLP